MRTSEALKIIKADPELYLLWLKKTKGTGYVNEARNGKLWRTHKVKNGVHTWKVWHNDKVIKRGVAK